jgi:hypothetical protein
VTQTDRIVRFVRDHPGCTALDLARGLDPFVANPRARISDARKEGHDIVCERGRDGVQRSRLVVAAEQMRIAL